MKKRKKLFVYDGMNIYMLIFNRPGVAGGVLQSPPSLIN